MKRAPAAVILAVLVLLAVAAPWIAPAQPDAQEDVAGAKLLPPLTSASAVDLGHGRMWIVTGLQRVEGGWVGERAGRALRLTDPEVVGTPSARAYLLGTDALGRDLASQLLYAVRHSLLLASLAVGLALVLGIGVGAVAGVSGGWVDGLVMRAVDVLLSIPRLLLFLLLAALFRPSILLLVLVLGGTTWPSLARLMRGEILSRKGGDLFAAARASGCSALRTVVVHLLPQATPLLAVTCALRFADTLVLESALSFLGLGAPPPAVSLGGIIAAGREDLAHAWWVVAWPVAVLSILVLTMRATAARIFSEPPSVV